MNKHGAPSQGEHRGWDELVHNSSLFKNQVLTVEQESLPEGLRESWWWWFPNERGPSLPPLHQSLAECRGPLCKRLAAPEALMQRQHDEDLHEELSTTTLRKSVGPARLLGLMILLWNQVLMGMMWWRFARLDGTVTWISIFVQDTCLHRSVVHQKKNKKPHTTINWTKLFRTIEQHVCVCLN